MAVKEQEGIEGKKAGGRRHQLSAEERVLAELEARCVELGIRIIYDDLQGDGGLCRVRDRYLVIVNRRVSAGTRVRIINEALKKINAKTRDTAGLKPPVVDNSLIRQQLDQEGKK